MGMLRTLKQLTVGVAEAQKPKPLRVMIHLSLSIPLKLHKPSGCGKIWRGRQRIEERIGYLKTVSIDNYQLLFSVHC
jgi:hypothetical protein